MNMVLRRSLAALRTGCIQPWLLALVAIFCSVPLCAQELPWQQQGKRPEGKSGSLSPREMLALLGVDDSHWDFLLQDGRPVADEEIETLTRLLFRMPRFDPPQWERWCQKEADLAVLAKESEANRASPFSVQGRAQQVEVVELLPSLIPLYQFKKYYRVTIATKEEQHPVVVFTREIPALWKEAKTLDEPVRVQAIFLKADGMIEEKTPLYFVTARLAWYPDKVNDELGVNEDLVWLAQRGMDISLWDEVRENNGAPIGASESECFYQLLARLKATKPTDLKELKVDPFDLAAMLQRPDALLGQAFSCSGTARRVQRVTVPEQFRERLGLDHYYEIDLFVPLDNQAIRLTPAPGEKEAPTFTDGFPTTFCVAKLPADFEIGENVHQQVQLKGVFFKLWAYQSDYIKKFNPNLRQPSPLLMGLEPRLLPAAQGPSWGPWTPTVVMFAIIIGVMTIWFATWRMMRGDKKFERKVLRKYTHGATEAPTTLPTPPESPESKP